MNTNNNNEINNLLGDKPVLSDAELNALHIYLDMYYDQMTEEEQLFWLEVLKKVDKEFYEDQDSGIA